MPRPSPPRQLEHQSLHSRRVHHQALSLRLLEEPWYLLLPIRLMHHLSLLQLPHHAELGPSLAWHPASLRLP